jgi:inositol-hexakisphosphate/diphosphoinositol-pentakisphosphate 1-kinase
LIAFFSEGFPLDKAIQYVKLRKPFVVNDLPMQKVLWDRRICLRILDQMLVPSPKRIEVNRDGGPRVDSTEMAHHLRKMSGVSLQGSTDGTGGGIPKPRVVEMPDDDTLVVDGQAIKKPFVEKPVSGEDHNIVIYFPRSHEGGGGRRLFRKIGNKSSEFDHKLIVPRCITEPENSYIYEQFLKTENAEDVKAYTVGPDYCHAETRKSPVVDGLVKRNTHGKEVRYVTTLTAAEKEMASRVSRGFGQRICGFDLLRANGQSFVIDVNGWSFVKDNEGYYNECAAILKAMFSLEKYKQENALFDDASSEGQPEVPHGRRDTAGSTTTSHPHRQALKGIFKSPSISKLSQHLPHGRHHQQSPSSPKPTGVSSPMSSPNTMERSVPNVLPGSKIPDSGSTLPPPSMPPPAASEPALSVETSLAVEASEASAPLPSSKHSWKLKGVVTVVRHADRTPKQKIKFTAHSQVFVDLLKGHHEEVLLKGEAALASVEAAVKTAQRENLEDQEKLRTLRNALARKRSHPATKVQIKPMFRKRRPSEVLPTGPTTPGPATPAEASIPEHAEPNLGLTQSSMPSPAGEEIKRTTTRSDSLSGPTFSRYSAAENDLVLDKLQLVMKWGGEPTHSARYQSQDLGQNMRDDFKLLNRKVLDDVSIFTSSEKRVRTSAQIWSAAFMGRDDIPEDYIQVRKDLLDDSNAAKDVMDKVKKKLKHLLREGNSVPEEFAWPKDVPEPFIVMQTVVELMRFHRKVMRYNFKKLGGGAAASLAAINGGADGKDGSRETVNVNSVQSRWCTGEDAELFKERWEKLFAEFCDSDKADPSKVSELYDTMKYDALHNKAFLQWIFTPSQTVIDEFALEEATNSQLASPESEKEENVPSNDRQDRHSFASKIGLRRRSVLAQPPSTPPLTSYEQDASYFKLFSGSGDSKEKQDKRLGRLRELYRYAKILFDYIGPQEYGISDHEKLEIGLLTSLPLLREIVQDLEELQATGDARSFVYFTKESHIYTLLNCIMEGGIHTKIKRATIPELDYLSQICFELYEAQDEATKESDYSIRISISPGCHTIDPLDISLDSKHVIGSAPRRSLTDHQDWKEVISTLKAKFDTVQLPKSFLAVNVSAKHEEDAQGAGETLQEDDGGLEQKQNGTVVADV